MNDRRSIRSSCLEELPRSGLRFSEVPSPHNAPCLLTLALSFPTTQISHLPSAMATPHTEKAWHRPGGLPGGGGQESLIPPVTYKAPPSACERIQLLSGLHHLPWSSPSACCCCLLTSGPWFVRALAWPPRSSPPTPAPPPVTESSAGTILSSLRLLVLDCITLRDTLLHPVTHALGHPMGVIITPKCPFQYPSLRPMDQPGPPPL